MMISSNYNIKNLHLFLMLVFLINTLIVSAQNVRVYGSVKNAILTIHLFHLLMLSLTALPKGRLQILMVILN